MTNQTPAGPRGLSIGAKLTLRYSAAVLVTVTLIGLVVYAQIAERINGEARLLLEVQAQELAEDFRAFLDTGADEQATDWLRDRSSRSVRNGDPELNLGIELFDGDGERLFGVGSLASVEVPVSGLVLSSGESLFRAINTGQPRPYLSLARPVESGVLRVAVDTARYADNVAHVRDVFLLALPVLLGVTALIGWFLSRTTLRPISNISASARTITVKNLADTVPESGSGDELDELAATLNHMLGRLRSSLDQMRRFNENAAHELRTPLAVIANQLDVTLEKPRTGTEYETVLSDLRERASEMGRAVDAMLRLAKVEAGLDRDRFESISLDSLLGTVCEFFDPVAQEKEIRLSTDLTPQQIHGDSSWLYQLFSNLLSNALRHTPRGGEVAVKTARRNDRIEIEVSDTGPGIEEDVRARVFERFERLDASQSESGFGLGLPIAREIARAHGGDIVIESNGGTCFRVLLPIGLPTESSTKGPA